MVEQCWNDPLSDSVTLLCQNVSSGHNPERSHLTIWPRPGGVLVWLLQNFGTGTQFMIWSEGHSHGIPMCRLPGLLTGAALCRMNRDHQVTTLEKVWAQPKPTVTFAQSAEEQRTSNWDKDGKLIFILIAAMHLLPPMYMGQCIKRGDHCLQRERLSKI